MSAPAAGVVIDHVPPALRTEAREAGAINQAFRFSTKYQDQETGLVYFGRRYYSSNTGRFQGRDPKGEQGGRNLYAFTKNDPVNGYDYLGMTPRWTYNPRTGKYTISESSIPDDQEGGGDDDGGGSFYGNDDDDDSNDDGDLNNDPADLLKKECDGLLKIVDTFRKEAQEFLSDFNRELAYTQKLQASFSSDNNEWMRNAMDLMREFGGDIAWGTAGFAIGADFAGLGNELTDAIGDASEGNVAASAGHVALGLYMFINQLRPARYRTPNFSSIANIGGAFYLGGKVIIKTYEHFGATINNELMQASIIEEQNKVTAGLMEKHVEQGRLADHFQRQYDDKGCDNL